MNRRLLVALSLLAVSACRRAPLADEQVSGEAPTASAPSLTPVAPSGSSATPPSSSPPSPTLPQLVLPGFPTCPPDNYFDPKKPRFRTRDADDMNFGARQLLPSFQACLRQALHEPAKVNIKVGILPSGRICGASLNSTADLSAACLECLARPMQRYRFSVADSSQGIVIPIRFEPAVPFGTGGARSDDVWVR